MCRRAASDEERRLRKGAALRRSSPSRVSCWSDPDRLEARTHFSQFTFTVCRGGSQQVRVRWCSPPKRCAWRSDIRTIDCDKSLSRRLTGVDRQLDWTSCNRWASYAAVSPRSHRTAKRRSCSRSPFALLTSTRQSAASSTVCRL
jgi:hypothetical protein